MGKPNRPFGLPRVGKTKRKEHREAIGMLLGAEWDAEGRVFIRETRGNNGGHATHWVEYFDESGRQLSLSEGERRADKGMRKRYRESIALAGDSISHGVWSRRLGKRFASEAHFRSYLKGNHTGEKNEKSVTRDQCNDTIRIARRPDVRTRK